METMRDIKRRINSIKNTQKITKAMKMVAAAKLRKAQEKAENARPFFNKTRDILMNIASYTNEPDSYPLLEARKGKRHLYIMINADRGLCGTYNVGVIDKICELISQEEEISLITIGRKGRDYFTKRGYNIISEYINLDDYPDYKFAKKIGNEIITLFKGNLIDKVSLVYTHFNSVISQKVKFIPLLPLLPPADIDASVKQVEYLYEPSPAAVMDILLPNYVNNILYSALLEAKASEFGARMTAMDAATDNAGELIDELTLSYNRVRQAAITKEITEIVGGTEALQ